MTLGRRLSLVIAAVLFLIPVLSGAAPAAGRPASLRLAPNADDTARAEELLKETPLLFERNDGQFGNGFDFVSRAAGHTFLIHPTGALVNLGNSDQGRHSGQVSLSFDGGNPEARAAAGPRSDGTINYYVGSDRSKWRSGVEAFSRLRYSGVYDGIDVEYYGKGGQLEYDLVVAPGADPRQIALLFDGASDLCLDRDGALVVQTAAGELRHVLPHIYQRDAAGAKVDVTGSFSLDGRKVRISLGAYDKSRELIIDPTVVWSHQFLSTRLSVSSMAVDGSGNVFIAGLMDDQYQMAGFDIAPVNSPFVLDANPGWTPSAFVMGIGPLKNVLFATYLGGNDIEEAFAIATANVSGTVGVYVLGATWSDDFPTTAAAFQQYRLSSQASPFVVKLNTSGGLVWSTFVSGEGNDGPKDIAVDSTGSAYLTGSSTSTVYPVTRLAGSGNAYVTKLTPDGSGIVYSTRLGGSSSTSVAIALDETNAAYVTGYPGSGVRVTPGAMACSGTGAVYVARLTPAGEMSMLTCVGATGGITAYDVAVDPAHDIYVVGSTTATDFPVTPNAYQSNGSTYGSGFYMRLDSSGSSIKYATYLGFGAQYDGNATRVFKVSVDSAGQAVLAAAGTALPDVQGFPYVSPSIYRIIRFSASDALEFSTAISGTLTALTTDNSANIWVVTRTPLSSTPRAYTIIRKISGSGSQQFALLDLDHPSRLVNTPGGFTANVDFGYFLNGVQLSIGGTPAIFNSLGGDVQPTQSFWTTPTLPAGVHSVTVVNGQNTVTVDNAFEHVDEPFSITSISPTSIDATAATTTVFTITGTGFGPEVWFGIDVPGSNPVQSYSLQTHRISKHMVKAVIPTTISAAWTGLYDLTAGNDGGGVSWRTADALTITGAAITPINTQGPNVGPTTGGTQLRFVQYQYSGNDLQSITVDGTTASGFAATAPGGDYRIITANTPAHPGTGRVPVTLTVPTGSYQLPNAFRYYQAVSISGVSPNTGSPSGGTSITISGSGFVNDLKTRVLVGGLLATVNTISSTSITATTPAHVPGVVTVAVRNADGGWAQLTSAFTYTGPVITSVSPSIGPSEGGTSVTVNVTGIDAGATVSFGGTLGTRTSSPGATPMIVTTPAHTAGIVDVVVANSNGDTGTLEYGFRFTNVPQITSFTPTSGGPGTSVVITGSKFSGASRVTFGGIVASFTVNSATQITVTVPALALTGKIVVTAGLDSGTSADTFYVAPRFGANPFSPASALPGTSISVNGVNFQGLSAVSFNGTAASTFSTNAGGTTITVTVPASATTGPVSVTSSGGSATSSTSFGVPPVVSSFTPGSGPTGTSVTVTGQRFTGATAVTFGGTAATSFTVNSPTSITAVSPLNSSGVICVTTPGGSGCSAAVFVGAPRVSSFSPTSGTPGTSVIITGLSFTGATQVAFNGAAASGFTVNSDTQITATVSTSATTGPISVTTANGTGTSSTNFTVLPYITGFTPTSGGSGTAVTISGYRFTGATAVNFGSGSATFTINSDTSISAVVPGTATTGPITVVAPGGTATSSTNFTVGAVIASFTPNKWTGAANAITITGNGFTGATAVSFGGTAATFTVNSATQITANVPSNPSTGYITVTTPLGSGSSTSLFYGITTFSSYTPASAARGDMIVINGLNFTGTTAVGFGNPVVYSEPVTITVLSNTQLRVQVPGFAQLGQVDIKVTTPYGDFLSPIKFTVTDALPPTLTAGRYDNTGAIAMYWTGAVMLYDIYRAPSAAGPWARILPPSTYVKGNAWVDSSMTPGQTYFYKVLRYGTAPEQWSNVDYGTAVVFADDPVVAGSTTIKALHLTQLRQAANMMRAAAGLSAYSWTNTNPTGVSIQAIHINELRTAITQVWPATFTDPGTIPAGMIVKAVHINDLRYYIK